MVQYAFSRELRLLTPGDFKPVFSNPTRAASPQLTLLAIPNGHQHPRIGMTIAKKHVRKACQRNRIKRVIRDSFRRHQHDLPAVDIVVIGKKGLDELDNAALHKLVDKLWRKLTRRCNEA